MSTDHQLTPDEMRAWLDRKPPKDSTWQDFEPERGDHVERDEYDRARETDPQAEAGHG